MHSWREGRLGQRRQKITVELIDAEGFKKLFKLNEWNDVIIIVRGNHIQHYMNGRLIMDFEDGHEKALLEGLLAFQLHAGKPMFAEFKDVRIRELSSDQ